MVAVIPARGGSKGLPGKNLKKFSDGTPLMSMIQRACLGTKLINDIYVYCSNSLVCEYLELGVKYLKRPESLDSNKSNCNDIIREFMKKIEADIYVVSHATGPFTKSKSIDACIEAVASGEYDSAFLGRKIQEFLWKEGSAINFDIQHFPRTQDLIPIYSEAPGAYVFSKTTFKTYDRRVGIKPFIYEISEIESRDIDCPEDFEIADAIYMKLLRNYNS